MKLRALIVEDCPVMRKLLMQALPVTGLAEFQFQEAEDGDRALARLDSEKTDILFVDWNLPRLSGIDLVRKVRATPKGARLPIVMVTGNGTTGNIADALDRAGADVYITKPYTVADLRRQLAKLIQRLEAERSAAPSAKRPGLRDWLKGGPA